jgi:hypothetical protein
LRELQRTLAKTSTKQWLFPIDFARTSHFQCSLHSYRLQPWLMLPKCGQALSMLWLQRREHDLKHR